MKKRNHNRGGNNPSWKDKIVARMGDKAIDIIADYLHDVVEDDLEIDLEIPIKIKIKKGTKRK